MKLPSFVEALRRIFALGFCTVPLLWTAAATADQVEMSNGDRYVGRVSSLSGETLVLQSEVLGTLRLPRAKISTITLEPRLASTNTNLTRFSLAAPRPKFTAGTNSVNRMAVTSTNASNDLSAVMQQLGGNSNVLRQVQDQLLAGAGPETQAKFNDLLGGLLSGKVDMAGLRAQAQSTLEQAKRVRGELGEEGGGMLDSYLAILDGFLKETQPDVAANTNTNAVPAASPKSTTPKAEQEE